jgi:hypothetical protein
MKSRDAWRRAVEAEARAPADRQGSAPSSLTVAQVARAAWPGKDPAAKKSIVHGWRKDATYQEAVKARRTAAARSLGLID